MNEMKKKGEVIRSNASKYLLPINIETIIAPYNFSSKHLPCILYANDQFYVTSEDASRKIFQLYEYFYQKFVVDELERYKKKFDVKLNIIDATMEERKHLVKNELEAVNRVIFEFIEAHSIIHLERMNMRELTGMWLNSFDDHKYEFILWITKSFVPGELPLVDSGLASFMIPDYLSNKKALYTFEALYSKEVNDYLKYLLKEINTLNESKTVIQKELQHRLEKTEVVLKWVFTGVQISSENIRQETFAAGIVGSSAPKKMLTLFNKLKERDVRTYTLTDKRYATQQAFKTHYANVLNILKTENFNAYCIALADLAIVKDDLFYDHLSRIKAEDNFLYDAVLTFVDNIV
jgi:hypothetical protein